MDPSGVSSSWRQPQIIRSVAVLTLAALGVVPALAAQLPRVAGPDSVVRADLKVGPSREDAKVGPSGDPAKVGRSGSPVVGADLKVGPSANDAHAADEACVSRLVIGL